MADVQVDGRLVAREHVVLWLGDGRDRVGQVVLANRVDQVRQLVERGPEVDLDI